MSLVLSRGSESVGQVSQITPASLSPLAELDPLGLPLEMGGSEILGPPLAALEAFGRDGGWGVCRRQASSLGVLVEMGRC